MVKGQLEGACNKVIQEDSPTLNARLVASSTKGNVEGEQGLVMNVEKWAILREIALL